MLRFFNRSQFLLALILALAAFLRLFQLDTLPPGFQFDQAYYVFDALRLLQGEFWIFFPDPGRSEPLYQYLAMVGVALFGESTPLGVKLTGAIIGTLTIPLVYGLGRALFKSARMALLSALFTAISLWHIFYSHYGERIVLTVFFAVLVFWFFWRALDLRRPKDFALTGIFTGCALYTYPSARILPLAIVLLTLYMLWSDRAHRRDYVAGLLMIGAMALVIFLPLASYYFFHPDDFISHASDVSIFVPHGEITDNVPLELWKNLGRILGMFFVVGDPGMLRNLPFRPVFDPAVGVLFVVGVALWLIQLVSPRSTPIERRRAVFLAVWLGLAAGLSLVSDDAPNNGRMLIGIPVVMLMPAWGIHAIWERLHQPTLRRVAALGFSAVIILSAALTFRDYFFVFANDPALRYVYNADKAELADWLNRHAKNEQIYLAPVTYQVSTISLLTRLAPLKSFESRDTIVLPGRGASKDAVFGFPPEQAKKIETLATRLGALGARDDVIGSDGAKMMLAYRVPAQNLPDEKNPLDALARGGDFIQPQKTTRAVWADSFELLGYSVQALDAPQRNLEVTLFFHALKPMTDDYTFSVKARDDRDRTWGQEDKWLGNNSYQTSMWSPGDVIVEKFYPGLSACAPAGEYRLTVEAYDPKTGNVLALSDREGNLVELGFTRAEASAGNRYDDLEPIETKKEIRVGDRLQLMGYTLAGRTIRLGDDFFVNLFWRGVGQGSTEYVTVRLRDAANRDVTLAQSEVKVAAEGRGVCTVYDFRIPRDLEPGAGSFWINDSKIADVNLTK